jgi:SAM-dependent methyltransferase
MARLWPFGRNITRRNLLTAAGGLVSSGFGAKWLFDAYSARRAASSSPPIAAGAVAAHAEDFIDVREFKATMSVEKLCGTAEEYYAVRKNWDYFLAKPLWNAEEATELLQNFAFVLHGLQLLPGMSVVDFGAGSCWASRWLTQLGMAVVALDVSQTALKIGQELYARLPVIGERPRPRFLVFDGHRINLADASVDRILCLDTFHHLLNPDDVLREMGRILRVGGIAGFSEPGPHHSQSPGSQFEMRNFKVLEDDIHVGEIWSSAQKAGFTRMTFTVVSPPTLYLSLPEFEDYLSGGQHQRVTEATRLYMQERRVFFLQKGAAAPVPDSRSRTGLAAALEVKLASSKVRAGTPLIAHVVVTNTGKATWLPPGAKAGAVNLGCHLLDSSGKMLKQDFFRYVLTPELEEGRPIAPGETLKFDCRMPLLSRGTYVLEFDLVSELVTWFSMIGSKAVRLAIEIT